MKKLQIRFLKSGLIEVPVEHIPLEIVNMSSEEQTTWADLYLSNLTDQQIVEAMKDIKNPGESSSYESLTTEAIQDPDLFDTPHESIYSTTAWNAFIDPDYGKNIIHENQNMAHFLSLMGFSQDNITSIATGSHTNVVSSPGLIDSYEYFVEKEVNAILSGTPYTACVIETSELYESDNDNDPYEGMPMYEASIVDDDENDVDEFVTGRYCELSSVREELIEFAKKVAKDYDDGKRS